MIYFDVTKAKRSGHRSGLMRVSSRLRDELGQAIVPVQWSSWNRMVAREDWFVTAELFSEEERPGLDAFLVSRRCRTAAIFHDAIPLQHPHITWPQSVARHPAYLKMLASFDRVWAVSETSRRDLVNFWNWQGVSHPPPVDVIPLGSDFAAAPRVVVRAAVKRALLCVGILEPRKNQAFLLEVCHDLWCAGVEFDLHVVGRVNPHFGAPVRQRLRALQRQHPTLFFHEAATDVEVAELYRTVAASLLPTIAEGCGLPLLESLWMGTPCLCSDLPVLRENAAQGGCLPLPVNDRSAWADAIRRILEDEALQRRLTTEATSRALPTWSDSANVLRAAFL